MDDVRDNFIWRQRDCIKNSISMAAQARFSHMELQGMGSEVKKSMLREVGADWDLEPGFFKYGTLLQRVLKPVELSAEDWFRIPEQHRPSSRTVQRHVTQQSHTNIEGALSTEFSGLFGNTL